MNHPSMELYRRYGSQISLDQLSLGFLVRGTNLKITYDAGNSQKRVLQLKFTGEADCQEMASIFGRLGLPVKAGVGGDRPGSRRLNTAGSWSMTPPNSQPRTAWSSHGSASSQTLPSAEPSLSMELPHLGSQARLRLPLPDMPRTSAGSSSPAAHVVSGYLLESREPVPRPFSSQARLDNEKPAAPELQSSAEVLPSRHPSSRSMYGQGYSYRFDGGAGELLETDPPSRYDINRQFNPSHFHEPLQGQVGDAGTPTLVSTQGPVRPVYAPRVERLPEPAPVGVAPPPSYAPSSLEESQQRPLTVHADGNMAPPPLPERTAASQARSWKRPTRGSVSPGRRSSTRLATKRSSAGVEEDLQHQLPSASAPGQVLLPRVSPSTGLQSTMQESSDMATPMTPGNVVPTASAGVEATGASETIPPATADNSAPPKPKAKAPRKRTSTKTIKSSGPARKRQPRKTKAQIQAEAKAAAQAEAPCQEQLPAQGHIPEVNQGIMVEQKIKHSVDSTNPASDHPVVAVGPAAGVAMAPPEPQKIKAAPPAMDTPAPLPVAHPSDEYPTRDAIPDCMFPEIRPHPDTTTPVPPPISPLSPPAAPSAPLPFLSKEEAEALFDDRFNAAIGRVMGSILPHVTEIEGSLRTFVDAIRRLNPS